MTRRLLWAGLVTGSLVLAVAYRWGADGYTTRETWTVFAMWTAVPQTLIAAALSDPPPDP